MQEDLLAMISAEESLARARALIKDIISGYDGNGSLVFKIVIEIGAEIIEEILPQGYDLNSVDLAIRYDTSRTPIREALLMLEKEGLVEIPPRRRPRVATIDLKTIREIYRTRAALLGLVAEDVVLNAQRSHLVQLRNQLTKLEQDVRENDSTAYMWDILEFYDLICEASGNQTAKRIFEALILRTITLRRWSLARKGRIEQSLSDHVALLRAFEAKDANLAAALVRSNHISALEGIETRFAAILPGGLPVGSPRRWNVMPSAVDV